MASGAAACTLAVKRIKNHTDAVRQCVVMMENIEILLGYKSLSTCEILKCLCESGNFSLLKFIRQIYEKTLFDSSFEDAYSEALSDKSITLSFDNEDLEFLKGFFSMLGKSDINGQIANCRIYREFFKTKLGKLEANEKNRVKTAVVLIFGIAAVISVIIA